MEIKDPIHGALEVNSNETHVLDSLAFQRLRSIKQLGFAEFAFPGATHNRFIHSLGVLHLAGIAFDNVFKSFEFSSPGARKRLRQTVRLAALLHDIGHGPLSHAIEEVMPMASTLKVSAYKGLAPEANRRATHEDYTIKFISDSGLTDILRRRFPDVAPINISCLIDKRLSPEGDFFFDHGLDLRPAMSQIVSSELDVDRMDYLERDAYFCGTNYGKVELGWLLGNLTCREDSGRMHLALSRRALYTFDDFLISRHHMYLMVYFHHKSIVYEEMLIRYLQSPDCSFLLPSDVERYVKCTDYALYEHLAEVSNPWAARIAQRRPFRMLFEQHEVEQSARVDAMRAALEAEGFAVIHASSQARLSKYHSMSAEEKYPIFVVDPYDPMGKPVPIEQCTEIFQKYEETRRIERLYVAGEDYAQARRLALERRF